MRKRLIIAILALFGASIVFAQNELPNDPEVKTGKLENGMTYFIRHNALPAGRAEFYLTTHVGAIQETPDQDGLAHFLEHMCFNGLKSLPGKQMLDYLQHIGAEFGRNINAGTGVEATEYMLNNIPLHREGVLDTCLMIIHDYSHFVLNDPAEIEAERGVIIEEKRTRNTADWRMWQASKPYFYGNSKYATCSLIGSEENLRNFKPESLKSFYETWYRPDLQAITVVGDIDVEQVYNKIVKLFADIPAPVNPKEKVMPAVDLNDSTLVGIITDKENASTSVDFIWKTGEPAPIAMNATAQGYFMELLKKIFRNVMNERLFEIISDSEAPFTSANMIFGDLCETCEAFEGSITCKEGRTMDACRTFLTEVEKMKRFGFNDEEVDRAKENIIKGLKNKVEGASTRKNADFIDPISNHFLLNYPYMVPDQELQLAQTCCAQINAGLVNQVFQTGFTGEHLAIVYYGIDKEGAVHPTKEQLLALVDEVKASEIKANDGAAINKDFMAGIALKAGSVVSEADAAYGAKELKLSNGLRVVVLPTEHKKNQVLVELRKTGGLSLVPTKDIAPFDENILRVFDGSCGIASYPASTVTKMLSGKTVSVGTYFDSIYNGIKGSCAPEDVETYFQLMHLLVSNPRFDQQEWDVAMGKIKAFLPNYVTTPDYVFGDHMYKDVFGNNPRKYLISEATLENADFKTYQKYYKKLLGDISSSVLYIVGNVNVDTLKPILAKYVASLPCSKKVIKYDIKNVADMATGTNIDVFKTKMAVAKASVGQFYQSPIEYSMQKAVNLEAASFILDMIYVETLREQESGTYGASAGMQASFKPRQKAMIQVFFDTNIEQQESLRALAIKGLKDLAENGPTEEQLKRARENALKNIPEARITNGYWLKVLKNNDERGCDYDAEYEQAVQNISAEGIRDILKEVVSKDNFCEIVMLPEE